MDTETAAISGVKPKVLLPVDGTHEVQGSGKRPWTIKRCKAEYYTCSCGAFQTAAGPTRKRSCAHLKAVLGDEYERARKMHEHSNTGASAGAAPPASSSGTKRKADAEKVPLESLTAAANTVASANATASGKARSVSPTSSRSSPEVFLSQSQSIHDPTSDACAASKSDYEDLVTTQGQEAWRKTGDNGLDYDAFTGTVTFNGRQRTKGYDKDTAIPIMLSETYDWGKHDPTGWWMSEKLDGVRAYWTGKKLISRSNIDWRPPQWFVDKLPKDFALDGELWRERDGFEELSGICRRADHSAWSTINYFVFDAPDVRLNFEERIKAALKRVPDGELSPDQALSGRFGGRIAMLPQVRCQGKEHLQSYLDTVEEMCGEGVMLRRPKSPYERKRSRHSLKVKSTYDAEAIVVGYTAGKGRHRGEMGSLGLLMECGTIFTCGAGLTNELRKHWAPARGSIVRYRFSELTADHVPRFPVFMGVCADKTVPKDAVCRTTNFRIAKKLKRLEEDDERERQRREDMGRGRFYFNTKVVQMDDLLMGKPSDHDA